jgi:D-alanyl-D-alanine endopeptidase (penicillin-binding protein 7)
MRKILLILLLLPLMAYANPNTVVYNVTTGNVIRGSLESNPTSIASISKLLTVYTVLKENQNLDEVLTVTGSRTPNTKLVKGMKLTRRELVNMSLVSSDNLAAITLSQNYVGGQSAFVSKMNQYAREMQMHHSGFVEPTGLSPNNYSTISDLVLLTNAVSRFDIVKNAAQTNKVIARPEGLVYRYKKQNNKKYKKRKPIKEPIQRVLVNNSTSNFFGREGVITIKTGFTNAAGFCITMLVESNHQLYSIVVLGARSKKERQQIIEKSLASIYNT